MTSPVCGMTLLDLLVAATNSMVGAFDMMWFLVPDEEKRQQVIAARIGVMKEEDGCKCEENGYPKYSCIEATTIVAPGLDEANLMNAPEGGAVGDELAEALEGTMPVTITVALGAYSQVLALVNKTMVPMAFGIEGLTPAVAPEGIALRAMGIEAEAKQLESVDDLVRDILGPGEGEAS